MLANVEPLVTDTKTELPTVSYDAKNREIKVTLICSARIGGYKIHCPMIALPGPVGSEWTVIWTLVADSGVSSATFNEGWIIAPWAFGEPLPDGVQRLDSGPVPEKESQWRMVFKNEITGSGLGVFHYDVKAELTDQSNGKSQAVYDHDPTIVVSKDPIEPPIGGGEPPAR